MLEHWQMMEAFTESPFVLLLVLFGISHLFYSRFFKQMSPAIASGSIVMAMGIFALACLPALRIPSFIMLIIALEIFIIWIYMSVKLVQALFQGDVRIDSLMDRVAIGTWVAGTAITAMLLDHAEQTLHGYIVFLGMVAILLYLFYFTVICQWLMLTIRKKFHLHVNGMILLATVSTQSIVLLLNELFRDDIASTIYFILISMGLVFYFFGLACILWHFLHTHKKHLLAGWPNANVINHGALSITGLAMLSTGSFSAMAITFIWRWSIIFFFLIEALELIRFAIRIRIKGFSKGIWKYHASQWTRIFTFSMLYAFTLSYYNKGKSLNLLVTIIANYGQYVVALLACAQLIITISYVLRQESKP